MWCSYTCVSSTRLKRKHNLRMPVTGTALLSCDTGVVYSTSCWLCTWCYRSALHTQNRFCLLKCSNGCSYGTGLLDFEGGHQNTHLYQYLISLCCEYILTGYFYPSLNLYNNFKLFLGRLEDSKYMRQCFSQSDVYSQLFSCYLNASCF